MSWLRIVLAAQLAFFAVWGGYLLTSHRTAEIVWLETEPVDPRDLLSGHFVALRYPIADSNGAGCVELHDDPPGTQVFVKLERSGKTVATSEGDIAISEAVECRSEAPDAAPGETWIVGDVAAGQLRRIGIVFGIERFFVPEDSPLRNVRSGDVVAKIAINSESRARIVDLVPTIE